MSFGFPPDAFWDQTFETLEICFDGKAEALEREHNERAWLAWHIAALPKLKEFPKLEKLLHRQNRPKREMTPDEMWALLVPLTYSKH